MTVKATAKCQQRHLPANVGICRDQERAVISLRKKIQGHESLLLTLKFRGSRRVPARPGSWSSDLRKVAESQPGHQARLSRSLNTGMPLPMQQRGGPTPTIFFPPFSNNIFIPPIFSPGISLSLLSTQECQQPISQRDLPKSHWERSQPCCCPCVSLCGTSHLPKGLYDKKSVLT